MRWRSGAGGIALVVVLGGVWLFLDVLELRLARPALPRKVFHSAAGATADDGGGSGGVRVAAAPAATAALPAAPPPPDGAALPAVEWAVECYAAVEVSGWKFYKSADACGEEPLGAAAALEGAGDLGCDAVYACPALCAPGAHGCPDLFMRTLVWALALSLAAYFAVALPFCALRKYDARAARQRGLAL